MRKIALFAVVAAFGWLVPMSGHCEKNGHSEKEFSVSKIQWVIPFRAGGGSDTWARFVAPFLERYLPGNPTVEVINRPGGGSIRGANAYANNVKLDGTLLLGTSASTQFPYLLGDPRVRYDYSEWRALLVYQTGGVVYATRDIFTADQSDHILQLRQGPTKRLVYGSQGATSIDLVPMLSFKLLGLDVKPIFGVRGRSAGRLAFERGDATIDFQTSAAYLNSVESLVSSGKAIPLYSLGALNEAGEMIRDPVFPDLPHLAEIFTELSRSQPHGVEWDSWTAFLSAGFSAQKFVVLPADTPDYIVNAYTKAFEQMKRDPEYLANRNRTIGAYEQIVGDAAMQLYQFSTSVPEPATEWVKGWLRSDYGLNL